MLGSWKGVLNGGEKLEKLLAHPYALLFMIPSGISSLTSSRGAATTASPETISACIAETLQDAGGVKSLDTPLHPVPSFLPLTPNQPASPTHLTSVLRHHDMLKTRQIIIVHLAPLWRGAQMATPEMLDSEGVQLNQEGVWSIT
jgi:hypothetical protein